MPPVQVTLQFTPDGGVVSFAMVAVKLAVLPASMEVGMVELIVTVSVGERSSPAWIWSDSEPPAPEP